MEISTLGIDLSKTTFHVIGFTPRGEIVLRKKLLSEAAPDLHVEPATAVDWHGSLWGRALPRSCFADSGPRCAAYACAVCEGVRQVEQERLSGCRGDCRSCSATNDAFCSDQDAMTNWICRPCTGYVIAGWQGVPP